MGLRIQKCKKSVQFVISKLRLFRVKPQVNGEFEILKKNLIRETNDSAKFDSHTFGALETMACLKNTLTPCML